MSFRPAAGSTITLVCVLALALVACSGQPSRQSADRPTGQAPAAAKGLDPAEGGLTDLARISRYVFREMRLRDATCGISEPLADRIQYTLEVEVTAGAVADARILRAEVESTGDAMPLAREHWPPGLVERISCLRPYLVAMTMAPAPADGRYATRFALAAAVGDGSRARVPAADPTAPDPLEPGLPDITRLARYVFREMGLRSGVCGESNPYRDPLSYTLRVQVRGGAVVRLALKDASLESNGGAQTLSEQEWPETLRRYVACVEIHVTALDMDPAPGDGIYDLEYVAPPAS